jgi:hypothetical protein
MGPSLLSRGRSHICVRPWCTCWRGQANGEGAVARRGSAFCNCVGERRGRSRAGRRGGSLDALIGWPVGSSFFLQTTALQTTMRSAARRDEGALFVGKAKATAGVRLCEAEQYSSGGGREERAAAGCMYVPRSSQQPRSARYVGEELVRASKRDGAGSEESFITETSQRASLTGASRRMLDCSSSRL